MGGFVVEWPGGRAGPMQAIEITPGGQVLRALELPSAAFASAVLLGSSAHDLLRLGMRLPVVPWIQPGIEARELKCIPDQGSICHV